MMKIIHKNHFLLLVSMTFFLFQPAAFSQTLETVSTIKEVVVFAGQAEVTRQAEVSLEPGTYEIVLANLPGSVEEDSIRVTGEGSAKVKLYDARLITQELVESASEKIRDLERKIEALKDQVRAQEELKSSLADRRKFINAIEVSSPQQAGKDLITRQPLVEDVQKIYSFVGQELVTLSAKTIQADTEIRELNRKIDALSRELEKLQTGGGKQKVSIEVNLEAETAGKFLLDVIYRLPGANWETVYDARADLEKNQVDLVSYALIRQNTGEEWQDVTVHLSTANPSLYGRMPEIQPWVLKKSESESRRAQGYGLLQREMAAKSEFKILSEKADVDNLDNRFAPASAPSFEAAQATAAVQGKGPVVHFVLPKKETIHSDGQPRKSAITSQTFKSDFVREITPRLSSYAYLSAKVQNQSDNSLLAGSVQIFLDGKYVGKSALNFVGVGEEISLFLGVDEQIHVEQKELKRKVDVSLLPGLRGKMKSIDFSYLNTIKNYSGKDVEVILFDQVPVSQHDEIKVEQITYEPAPAEGDPEKPGVQKWKIKVTPAQKTTVKLSYRVRYPEDYVVTGL
ncbi:MAG: mucoidy inhibitor MuiA family protein [Candidatus Omnitrophica bacterium]|nr:mucoidy inhibitor MuiA family protein [Candidatus Omnitrophota bacterium]